MTRHPFQKLCCVETGSERPAILLAAAGTSITSFNLIDGSILARYPPGADEDSDDDLGSGEGPEQTNGERPPKRRKVGCDEVNVNSRQESEDSVEIVAERQKGQRRKPKIENSSLPNVSHLISTTAGQYLIAVTAEDKAINVFAIKPSGKLSIQSRRTMPKRLCAIVLTPDERTILAGDKFGDVYSLPLHPSKDYRAPSPMLSTSGDSFRPSATELTVHTQGNLEALRQQRERRTPQGKKESPTFEHKLLLGHVSLLTDVAIAEIQFHSKQRQYILTSDRDEHIRVSRGLSQAYIIENYCLGHREFVSKLCILPWAPNLLVAGSGEPSLRVFDWQSSRLLDEEPFNGAIQQEIGKVLALQHGARSFEKLTVSGIWPVNCRLDKKGSMSQVMCRFILVALEGLPIILSYAVSDDAKLHHHQTINLGGNVLDITLGSSQRTAIASIDTVHRPGSMNLTRPDELAILDMVEVFELFEGRTDPSNEVPELPSGPGKSIVRWEPTSLALALNAAAASDKVVTEVPAAAGNDRGRAKGDYSALGEFLYGLENLRKKRGIGGDETEVQGEIEGDGAELEG